MTGVRVAIGCAGALALVAGAGWIYPPLGLLVLGGLLLRAYKNLKDAADARQPK